MRQGDILEMFTYHSPSEGQVKTMNTVRKLAANIAEEMNKCVPDCADKTHAIRKLREAVMSFNSAVVLEGLVSGYSTAQVGSSDPHFKTTFGEIPPCP